MQTSMKIFKETFVKKDSVTYFPGILAKIITQ